MPRKNATGLMSKEERPVTEDSLEIAVTNKQILDNAIRVAITNAQREVGVETFTCYYCGSLKHREEFYESTDPDCLTGVTRICQECCGKIIERYEDVAEGLYEVLSYIDYPWLYEAYQLALNAKNFGGGEDTKKRLVDRYIRAIKQLRVKFVQFKDSEEFSKAGIVNAENSSIKDALEEEYAYNRRDVIRLIGYDPFEDYPIEEDKIRLYAQLLGFIDEETKNDGMKMNAVIQIVKKLNQAEKMNTQIDLYINDSKSVAKNMVLIDRMSSASQKLMSIASSLAKDNGISVNFNANKSAGASTLSGKVKKLNEIGLRSAKINTFDVGTCEGMRQVAEISEEARHKRIGYDENIAAEIKDIKVELVEQMTKERDEAKELARRLITENKDLKDFLRAKGLVDENFKVIENVQ